MKWYKSLEHGYYMTGIGEGTKKVIEEYMREGRYLTGADLMLVQQRVWKQILEESEKLTRKLDGVNWYKFKERHELKKSIHWLEAVLEFL